MTTPRGFTISKTSPEPAYAQLASRIKRQIADGVYPPGSQIPTELALSKSFGISPMTVRRAIGLLTDEGLLKASQGRGTFVQSIEWQSSGFSLKPLADLIASDSNTKVKILKISPVKADERLAETLETEPGAWLIHVLRLLLRDGQPILLQSGFIIYDPDRPLLEAELDIVSLKGLLSGAPNTIIKKGEIGVMPKIVSAEEAALLRLPESTAAFTLEYLFWDFQDAPIGYGFFLVPNHFIVLKTKIGLWLADGSGG
jgi:DNA-binding GntR family transcriptional regulator